MLVLVLGGLGWAGAVPVPCTSNNRQAAVLCVSPGAERRTPTLGMGMRRAISASACRSCKSEKTRRVLPSPLSETAGGATACKHIFPRPSLDSPWSRPAPGLHLPGTRPRSSGSGPPRVQVKHRAPRLDPGLNPTVSPLCFTCRVGLFAAMLHCYAAQGKGCGALDRDPHMQNPLAVPC